MTKKFKIGITDYISDGLQLEKSAFPEAEFYLLSELTASECLELRPRLDALLVWHERIDSAYLTSLDKCRIIVRYGVGYDAIDLDSVKKASKIFCNTPDYGTEEVADTAVAMMLNLARGISRYDHSSRSYIDSWQENTIRDRRRLSSLNIGVIGLGRIGTAVALRMQGFGCTILGYDPFLPSGHEKAIRYRRTETLKELLAQSDVVSIHCPLNMDTAGMVNSTFLGNMKSGSILVNTARGGLVSDLDDIFDVLKTNHLWGAGLDVLPHEPPGDCKLTRSWRNSESWIVGRLLISPHTAFYSEEAWKEMRYKASETARLFLLSDVIRNRVV